jgi:membrane-bound acyltransferase YfiQ involved in biofilm formation
LSTTVYGKVGSKAIAEVLRYLGIVSMLAIFKHYRGALSSNKKVGRGLQYVGKLTLDIYLLHYFFLPNLPTLGEFFMGVENTALELVVSGALAMLVVVLCLIVSKVIRTSPFLAQYLLGESNKKKKNESK